jgi:hypothetical protein
LIGTKLSDFVVVVIVVIDKEGIDRRAAFAFVDHRLGVGDVRRGPSPIGVDLFES